MRQWGRARDTVVNTYFTLGAPHHRGSAACVHLGLLLTVVVAMPTRAAAALAATRPLTGSGLVA